MNLNIGIGSNIGKSPYFNATVTDGVSCFSVYNHMYIPAHFGDPIGEYKRLTEGVAMWGVAAQRQVEIVGPDAMELWVKAIAAERKLNVEVFEPDVSPLAIQGPRAEDLAADLFGAGCATSGIFGSARPN